MPITSFLNQHAAIQVILCTFFVFSALSGLTSEANQLPEHLKISVGDRASLQIPKIFGSYQSTKIAIFTNNETSAQWRLCNISTKSPSIFKEKVQIVHQLSNKP